MVKTATPGEGDDSRFEEELRALEASARYQRQLFQSELLGRLSLPEAIFNIDEPLGADRHSLADHYRHPSTYRPHENN